MKRQQNPIINRVDASKSPHLQYKTQFRKSCELCESFGHLTENCLKVIFCMKCKKSDHRTCEHTEYITSRPYPGGFRTSGESSSSQRPRMVFPQCVHCGRNNHHAGDCAYAPYCNICGSTDHDSDGHDHVISLRRGIKPRNPKSVPKACDTCGSVVHTTRDHGQIEWFRRGEALQASKRA